ncbi:ANTAR domain-containing protein [Dehalobacterium formicoaceticum]|uniref:Stage 0 sporulation protein A homolog n=1 Tax=Dehalobacterium formicoaceticum TaxID=51515 RepID=A0ABT1Y0J3_9FIRM|nr:ANTAR domain-containing protein [Dehalobacterium formicoaceticum]MCR6544036.1 ANTAR domain-containing protein [Dehalobacterium formicoaceticum]
MFGGETKIFIGAKDRALRKRIKSILQRQGYLIVGEAEDGAAALRIIRRLMPDLVILDKDLPGFSGLELTRIIKGDKIAPVILLTSSWEQPLFEKTKDSWVFAFLVKPIQEGHLLSTASFVLQAFQKMICLERQVDELKESIETRKLVERAKGFLMKKLSLSESEAYRRMQQQSMDQCLSMRKIAQAIISNYE